MTQSPSPAERQRQIAEFIEERGLRLRGQPINSSISADYFTVGDDTRLYRGDAQWRPTFIDSRESRGDVVIPEGATRNVVTYNPPEDKNVMIDRSPHGYHGRDEQQVLVAGDRNRINFVAGGARGNATISGDGNQLIGGRANDRVELASEASGNRIYTADGNDTIVDTGFRNVRSAGTRTQANVISGGAGTDAFQLAVYRGYQRGALDTRPESYPAFDVTFDRNGWAHIRDQQGNAVAQLMPDVERLEIQLEKGDLYPNRLDDTYRMDMGALREAFRNANITYNGAAQGDVTPVRVTVAFDGVEAGTPRGEVPVTRIAGR